MKKKFYCLSEQSEESSLQILPPRTRGQDDKLLQISCQISKCISSIFAQAYQSVENP